MIGLNSGAERLTLGRNLHSDVSVLVDSTDPAKAQHAYGYTPYGAEDGALTSDKSKNADGSLNPDVKNAFRFNGARLDTGSGSLDMGFRRFSPDTGRFTQSDLYHGALNELNLSADPLTQNRYAFAGGISINFVEVDGHQVNPSDGSSKNWCTAVPDVGRVGDRVLFDFRDACSKHDPCYGEWDSYRVNCDAAFGRDTQASCLKSHPFRLGWPRSMLRDNVYRTACMAIAGAYFAGVSSLGHVFSWMDKAYRDDRRSDSKAMGCNLPGPSTSTARRLRCAKEVRSRSYAQTIARQDAMYAAEKLASSVRATLRALKAFDWGSLIPDWRKYLPSFRFPYPHP